MEPKGMLDLQNLKDKVANEEVRNRHRRFHRPLRAAGRL